MLYHPVCRRGQLILIMSITLIAVILAVSMIIYLTSTQHLFFNYNPSREIILSIDSDFDRVLTRILADATKTYNMTSILVPGKEPENAMLAARILANQTFSYWDFSTRAAYTGKGLDIWAEPWLDMVVQKNKKMQLRIGSGDPIEIEYPERRLDKRLFKLWWYRPNSISAIGADIGIDSATGVIGWRSRHIVLLNLTINSISTRGNRVKGNVYVNITVLREDDGPVNDLRIENFEIYIFDPTVDLKPGEFWWRRMPASNLSLTYNGGGNYNITIIDPLKNPKQNDEKTEFFWDPDNGYYRFILLRVQDNRGIIVEAYSYSGIEYTIAGLEWDGRHPSYLYKNDPRKNRETYIFELLPNGTIMWFNQALDSPSKRPPPIPLPPVKQIRLQATTRGPGSGFEDIDYQIESWDDRFLWPNEENFIVGYRRLMNGSKIVFQVNYPPGVGEQGVRIIWLEDCDADTPDMPFQLEYIEGIQVAHAKEYTLLLIVNRDEAEQQFGHVDWTMSLRPRDAPMDLTYIGGIDYTLLGYDSLQKDAYYIPYKIPEADWTVLPKDNDEDGIVRAIVRAVAFRKTNRTVTTVEDQYGRNYEFTDEIYHEAIIYIPYDAPYFLYYVNATWLKEVNIKYRYLVLMGMIGGRMTDPVGQVIQKYKWGSLPTYSGVVNGTFRDDPEYTLHRGYALGVTSGGGDYSPPYWATLYNESFGAAIFASDQMLRILGKYGSRYKVGNRETDQLWVWTRGSGASRFMEYDAITLESQADNNFKIDISGGQGTPKIEFRAAGFVLDGGLQGGIKFDDDNIWNDRGDSYAQPFTKVEDPIVEGTGTGELGEIIRLDRSAFICDDFSTNPFSGGLTTTGTGWSWKPEGYIEVSADRTGTGGARLYYAYYANKRIPSGTSVVYVLSNISYIATANNQHVGLMMANQQLNRFYMLEFYRDTGNNRRLGIWLYSGGWTYLSRTGLLNLPDGRWSVFLGSRVVSGTGNGLMTLKVYSGAGEQGPDPATSTSFDAYYLGLGIRDPNQDNNLLTARFDYFIACNDTDPRFVTVKGLSEGWTVIISDNTGFQVQSTAGPDGTARVDVSSKPIIRNGIIEIHKSEEEVLSKQFNEIYGGDVYVNIISRIATNAVDQCNMYYRMFTLIPEDMPFITNGPNPTYNP